MPIISNFPSGDSAYAKAKAAGYTGTEDEFNKALAEAPEHITNKQNPHGVTAEQAGALPLSGGEMTGPITLGANSTLVKRTNEDGGTNVVGMTDRLFTARNTALPSNAK